jgi:hypothetical protein
MHQMGNLLSYCNMGEARLHILAPRPMFSHSLPGFDVVPSSYDLLALCGKLTQLHILIIRRGDEVSRLSEVATCCFCQTYDYDLENI